MEAEVYRRPGQVALQELKASLAKEARKVRGEREGGGLCAGKVALQDIKSSLARVARKVSAVCREGEEGHACQFLSCYWPRAPAPAWPRNLLGYNHATTRQQPCNHHAMLSTLPVYCLALSRWLTPDP